MGCFLNLSPSLSLPARRRSEQLGVTVNWNRLNTDKKYIFTQFI